MRHRTSFILLLALVLAVPALASAFDAHDVPTVFSIRKSTNDNRFDFGIALDERCRPTGDEPVQAYLRRATGSVRQLSFLERTVVGTSGQRVVREEDGGRVSFRIRSLPERTVTISVRPSESGCRATATTRIDGVTAVLTDIYVVLDGPRTVNHVELRGRATGGRSVEEHIRP